MKDDNFLQIKYSFNQWKPIVRHRKLRMIKTGTWFFGLFNTYRIEYTEWE